MTSSQLELTPPDPRGLFTSQVSDLQGHYSSLRSKMEDQGKKMAEMQKERDDVSIYIIQSPPTKMQLMNAIFYLTDCSLFKICSQMRREVESSRGLIKSLTEHTAILNAALDDR